MLGGGQGVGPNNVHEMRNPGGILGQGDKPKTLSRFDRLRCDLEGR
jgi:hypothetical protein